MKKFPNQYKVLNCQTFSEGQYRLIPIRFEDRFEIMKWRNEQIYHLRQSKPLTEEDQDMYFNEVVAKLFEQQQPSQILFSFLEKDIYIGYGGLVHINWIDQNAEISFVMNTLLEKQNFKKYWSTYLGLLEQVAFRELRLHKIYTYAFDIRPKLYDALENIGFRREAILKNHCFIESNFKDVVIHSKFNSKTRVMSRRATESDAMLLFNWANDKLVRENSINTQPITWDRHSSWFLNKLNNSNSVIIIYEYDDTPIGQVRLDKHESGWLIDFSVDSEFRRKGLGKIIIEKTIKDYPKRKYLAFVKKDNISSTRVFESLRFLNDGIIIENGVELIKYTK